MVIRCYKYRHSNHGITVYGYHTSTYSAQVVTNLYYGTDILVKLTTPSHLAENEWNLSPLPQTCIGSYIFHIYQNPDQTLSQTIKIFMNIMFISPCIIVIDEE